MINVKLNKLFKFRSLNKNPVFFPWLSKRVLVYVLLEINNLVFSVLKFRIMFDALIYFNKKMITLKAKNVGGD